MWPGEPLRTGKVIEMNDRRAVVVGVFRSSQTFMTLPIVYTRFSQATLFVPPSRRMMPFVLAKCQPGERPEAVAARIEAQTGLKALTKSGFITLTMMLLPATHRHPDQLRHDGDLGVPGRLRHRRADVLPVHGREPQAVRHAQGDGHERPAGRGMILIQALVVGGIGYGLGVGLATVYGIVAQRDLPLLAFFLPWQVVAISGAAVLVIALVSSLLSIRRVLVLEPAVVFQGGT